MEDFYKDIIIYLSKFLHFKDFVNLSKVSKKFYTFFAYNIKFKMSLIRINSIPTISEYCFISKQPILEIFYPIFKNGKHVGYNNPFKYTNIARVNKNDAIIKSSLFKIFHVEPFEPYRSNFYIELNTPNIEYIYGIQNAKLSCEMNKLKYLMIYSVSISKTIYIYKSVKTLVIYDIISLNLLLKHFPNVEKLLIHILFDDLIKYEKKFRLEKLKQLEIAIHYDQNYSYNYINTGIGNLKLLCPNLVKLYRQYTNSELSNQIIDDAIYNNFNVIYDSCRNG